MLKKSIIIIIFIFFFLKISMAERNWLYFYEKGVIEYKDNMYEDAVFYLSRALEKNPIKFKAANILGEISLMRNKKQDALDFFKMSLQINDLQPDIHCKIGELYEFYLEYERSYNHYSRSITLDPNHKKSQLNLVRYYIKRNDGRMANKHFEICYNLGKTEGEKYYKFAINEIKKKKDNNAFKFLRQALKENPAMVDVHFQLSEIYRRKRDYKNAIIYLENIKEIKPEFEKLNTRLGYLYLTKGLSGFRGSSRNTSMRKYILGKAKENFKEAIRLDPDNSELYFMLSQVYTYLGNDEKAYNILQKVIEHE